MREPKETIEASLSFKFTLRGYSFTVVLPIPPFLLYRSQKKLSLATGMYTEVSGGVPL